MKSLLVPRLEYFRINKPIQLSAVIKRSNIARHYINDCKNWCWIHKKNTPYLALTGSYGISSVNICEKIDRVITAPHCTMAVDSPAPYISRSSAAMIQSKFAYPSPNIRKPRNLDVFCWGTIWSLNLYSHIRKLALSYPHIIFRK